MNGRRGGLGAQRVDTVDVQVDGLLAQDVNTSVDGLVDEVDVGGRGRCNDHHVDFTRRENVGGVGDDTATEFLGDSVGAVDKHVADHGQFCARRAGHGQCVDLTDTAGADQSYSYVLGHCAPW